MSLNPLISRFKKDTSKKAKVQLIAGVVIILLVVLFLLYFNPHRNRKRQGYVKPVVKQKKEDFTKEAWLAKASSQLESQNQKIKQLEKTIKELNQELKNRKSEEAKHPQNFTPVKAEKKQHTTPKSTVSKLPYTYPAPPQTPPPAPAPSYPQGGNRGKQPVAVSFIGEVKGQGGGEAKSSPVTTIEAKKHQEKTSTGSSSKDTIEDTIPAGSFTTGVLLSGLDAPTGGQASSSPHPVLIRLTDLTILPNKFQTDLKSCFVIGEGYGDLSSERAYIRVNTLSCVKNDGTIIQKSITGYVSGEDGKIGLKGRVVSKQGALLARALVAGFLQGASNILQEQGSTISISPLGSTSTISPSEATKVAMYSGASKAAEKLADFYMKMVKDEFPVIEINAGRKVDIVFLKKVKLD